MCLSMGHGCSDQALKDAALYCAFWQGMRVQDLGFRGPNSGLCPCQGWCLTGLWHEPALLCNVLGSLLRRLRLQCHMLAMSKPNQATSLPNKCHSCALAGSSALCRIVCLQPCALIPEPLHSMPW